MQHHIFSPYRVCPLGAHVDQSTPLAGDSLKDALSVFISLRIKLGTC